MLGLADVLAHRALRTLASFALCEVARGSELKRHSLVLGGRREVLFLDSERMGTRIAFVPDDEIQERPKIKVREPGE